MTDDYASEAEALADAMPPLDGLFPTPARVALMCRVRDLKVADDEHDHVPYLHLGGHEYTRVEGGIRELETAGWVYRIPDGLGWRLTQRGLDILEGRR